MHYSLRQPTIIHDTAPVTEEQGRGSPGLRFLSECATNSLFFPLATVGCEIVTASPGDNFSSAPPYMLITAGLLQACYLSIHANSSPWHRLTGNLIGPILYSIGGYIYEGPHFWLHLLHCAYWGFALTIAILQFLRAQIALTAINPIVIISENIIRTSIILFLFYTFQEDQMSNQHLSIQKFFNNPDHQVITFLILFLGTIAGLTHAYSEWHVRLLTQTIRQFNRFAEWLLGRKLLHLSLTNPDQLTLQRRERSILFMDIRGFTTWSEHRMPEEVVQLLNSYYQIIEQVFSNYQVIKYKLSADEAMAIFPDPTTAIQAAIMLRSHIQPLLDHEQLGVGIGIHHGPVVEGLLGSRGVRFYDVIGDTVNTAKHLESVARKGEILVSTRAYQAIDEECYRITPDIITVKGKKNPLQVCVLSETNHPLITNSESLALQAEPEHD